MKLLFGILAMSLMAMAGTEDGPKVSVLDSNAQPILVDNGPVIATQDSVLEKPAIIQSQTPTIQQDAPVADLAPIVAEPYALQAPMLGPICTTCTTCRCLQCCCKPKRRVETTLCLIDPAGCTHEACVRIPVCCMNEAPIVSWQGKLFGRQVATLCWNCCEFEAKVVVTRRGKVRVRD